MKDAESSAPGQERIALSAADLRQRQPLVIADFMRPMPGQARARSGMQNTLTHNLLNWLEPALQQVFAHAPACAIWDETDPETLPSSQIYENHDIDPSTVGWTKTYRATPTGADLDLMRPLVADRLIIGFELSPFQCAMLNQLGIPYLSLAVHPLRFLDDYHFMLDTNFAQLEALHPLALTTEEIRFAAQLKRADMLRQTTLGLHDKSAVLFGQVEIDASLIGDRGVISLQDHIDDVRRLCAEHETVYFKPHPYAPAAADQVRALQQFGNVEYLAHNAYALLAAREVTSVAALTSSVLTEARYFDKTPRALSSLWRDRSDEPAYGLEVLSPRFWEALVTSADSTDPVGQIAMRGAPDVTVQSLLNVSWETFGAPRIPPSGVSIPIGRKLFFGKDNDADIFCTGPGWQGPATDHRWTGPGDACLSFRLPAGNTTDFIARLTVSGMANADFPVLVQLQCQDMILAEALLTDTGARQLEFKLKAAMRSVVGDVEIRVVCHQAHAPNVIISGLSDQRALSVAVYNLTVDLPHDALLFRTGETLMAHAFPTDPPFLPHGWHTPEADGIWTNGRNSRLQLMVNPLPDEDLVLTLKNIRAFLSDVLPQNTLFVRLNDRNILTHQFRRGEPGDQIVGGIDIEVPVPREVLSEKGGRFTVDLEMLACHAPQLAGYSEDTRPLGLMIEGFGFDSAIRVLSRRPSAHVANIFGPFNIHTGLGTMARNSFRALQDGMVASGAGQPAAPALLGPRAVNFNNSRHQDRDTGFVQHGADGSDINIFTGDVTRIARIVRELGNDILRDRYNICYGAWELETLPTYLADTRYIDEYWALSTFIADAARARMDVPVHAFPIPVGLHFPDTLAPRAQFGIPDDAFAFLFGFSIDSTMARKNPQAALDAFQLAFPDPDEPVVMVFKSMIRQASQANRKEFDAFKDRARQDPRVILVEETLSHDDNASLYMQCDAYISLHRAEGFGLTMAEAMGYGKPTIGTGYSGNLDFMTEDNSCLVQFTKVDMDPDAYHNQQGRWAEPDIHDAARHMQRIYSDILFREKIARAGKATIHDHFSSQAVGRKLFERLEQIRKERG